MMISLIDRNLSSLFHNFYLEAELLLILTLPWVNEYMRLWVSWKVLLSLCIWIDWLIVIIVINLMTKCHNINSLHFLLHGCVCVCLRLYMNNCVYVTFPCWCVQCIQWPCCMPPVIHTVRYAAVPRAGGYVTVPCDGWVDLTLWGYTISSRRKVFSPAPRSNSPQSMRRSQISVYRELTVENTMSR